VIVPGLLGTITLFIDRVSEQKGSDETICAVRIEWWPRWGGGRVALVNLQAIPRDSGVVKRVFVPKLEAFSFFDYVQVEPRVFAYFAARLGDDTIAGWYREGRDVYREIAARVLAKSVERVTESERQQGKVWFLMSLYGAGPKAIAEQTGMRPEQARAFYREFHERLPQIRMLSNPRPRNDHALRSWQPGAIERQVARRGYLRNPWGRHLHPEPGGEYKLLNTLIQSSAADLMKSALRAVDHWLITERLGTHMVSVIHDELIFDGTIAELPLLHQHVPGLMTAPDDTAAEINTIVAITVSHDVSTTNWAEKIAYQAWLAAQQPSYRQKHSPHTTPNQGRSRR
jgi:DNA polymerase I-like protein with 3'-5' exonuclease and polymerase domains